MGDQLLEMHLAKVSSQGETAVRDAFTHIEERLRSVCGLSHRDFGAALVDRALHPEDGVLQPFSEYQDERDGIYRLFHGAFLYFRNPMSHRATYHDAASLADLVALIRHLSALIDLATQRSIDPDKFLGRHEGRIASQEVFRLDVDEDGVQEIVVLIETFPVTSKRPDRTERRSVILIVDSKDGRQLRLPVETVVGGSMYGPIKAELNRITGSGRPDLIARWTSGESGEIVRVYRWTGTQYDIVRFDFGKEVSEDSGISLYGTQEIHFSDFDGDGLTEIIRTRHMLADQMAVLGFPDLDRAPTDAVLLCEVFKWIPLEGKMMQINRNLIVEL